MSDPRCDDAPTGGQPDDVAARIREAWRDGSPAGWFEPLYADAKAGLAQVPWALMEPNPQLIAWLDAHPVAAGATPSALVVGCGLGDDAQVLAQRGYDVVAFDISPSAIAWAESRFPPHERVQYMTVDLFDAPESWRGRFDFVFECRNIQALPHTLADSAMRTIAGFVKAGGDLLVLCHGRDPHEPKDGIPWPLSRAELETFRRAGLVQVNFNEQLLREKRRFAIEYHKPDDDTISKTERE